MKPVSMALLLSHSLPSWGRRALREPLCQFLLLGGLIFALDASLNASADPELIRVDQVEIERLRALSVKQWGREPDTMQVRALVEQSIREEVLVREAQASGLDREDSIVRRRLAQKMEFLAQSDVPLPTEAEVLAYYQAHPEQYLAPAELSFTQLFFDPRHGDETALQRARLALERLQEHPEQAQSGDPLPLPVHLAAQPRALVARDFGDVFAAQLFELPPGQWQGPLISPHGLHLVRVEHREAAGPLVYALVRERVANDLINLRQQQARDDAYQALRGRYRIEVARIDTDRELAAQ